MEYAVHMRWVCTRLVRIKHETFVQKSRLLFISEQNTQKKTIEGFVLLSLTRWACVCVFVYLVRKKWATWWFSHLRQHDSLRRRFELSHLPLYTVRLLFLIISMYVDLTHTFTHFVCFVLIIFSECVRLHHNHYFSVLWQNYFCNETLYLYSTKNKHKNSESLIFVLYYRKALLLLLRVVFYRFFFISVLFDTLAESACTHVWWKCNWPLLFTQGIGPSHNRANEQYNFVSSGP